MFNLRMIHQGLLNPELADQRKKISNLKTIDQKIANIRVMGHRLLNPELADQRKKISNLKTIDQK